MANLTTTSNYMAKTATKLKTFVHHLENGQGTVSMMVRDTVFVNDLKQTMVNINEGSARFNEKHGSFKTQFSVQKILQKTGKKQE